MLRELLIRGFLSSGTCLAQEPVVSAQSHADDAAIADAHDQAVDDGTVNLLDACRVRLQAELGQVCRCFRPTLNLPTCLP